MDRLCVSLYLCENGWRNGSDKWALKRFYLNIQRLRCARTRKLLADYKARLRPTNLLFVSLIPTDAFRAMVLPSPTV
jgi:hypothetical protein